MIATEQSERTAIAKLQRADPEVLECDDAAWDEFVARGRGATYLQTTAWAAVKRANGWRSSRVAMLVDETPLGAQMLIRRAGRLSWSAGYVPRGPIGADLDATRLAALTARLRDEARAQRVAYVIFEPEAERGSGLEAELARLGWRRTTHVQPEESRILDLRLPVDRLWTDMRGKWRQYVNKARRMNIVVHEAGSDRIGDFYRVYSDAYRRAGVTSRSEASFELLWGELEPLGMAHLFLAGPRDGGEVVAAFLLVSCGRRVFEVYGGSTQQGNDTRANYLLKWEAIVACREQGFQEYDMYGIPTVGIAHFKSGFGGREVSYVGAWELVVDPVGGAILSAVNALRARYVRLRYGRSSERRRHEAH